MRLFIFKSETRRDLRAFAGEPSGSALPANHGPWTATGIVAATAVPPHGISRDAIEKAIADHGFQMWRVRRKEDADA